MLLFLDTEFSGFIHQEMVSIGLVSEDGKHEFYAERKDLNIKHCSEEVIANILPLLEKNGHNLPDLELCQALRNLFEFLPERAIVLCDYTADATLFQDAITGFGLGLPFPEKLESVQKIDTELLSTMSFIEGQNALWKQKNRYRHHALHDAIALKSGWINMRKSFHG